MTEILNVALRNGDNIDYSLIKRLEQEAAAALLPFEKEMKEQGLQVELKILREGQGTVTTDISFRGVLWPKPLLAEVRSSLLSVGLL